MAAKISLMSREELKPLYPFLSLVFIIATLLVIVFFQMEERRLGYVILKLTREQRAMVEEKRAREFQLTKMTRPQYVETLARHQLTLKKVQRSQIIQLTGISSPISAGKELN